MKLLFQENFYRQTKVIIDSNQPFQRNHDLAAEFNVKPPKTWNHYYNF